MSCLRFLASALVASLLFASPGWGQDVQKLLPPTPQATAGFGRAVAVDGDLAVIGAPGDLVDGEARGAVYVYRHDGRSWVHRERLVPSDENAEQFGHAVSVHRDVIVVGAPRDRENGRYSGAAYVYRYDGARWNHEAKLAPSGTDAYDQVGSVVAATTEFVVVGSRNRLGEDCGLVHVFRRVSDGRWTEETTLHPEWLCFAFYDPDFGRSVAIQDSVIAVGAPGVEDPNTDVSSGVVDVFRRDSTGWQKEANLFAGDGHDLGWAVAVDGNTIIAGAPDILMEGGSGATGSAFVFSHDGSGWTRGPRLLPGDRDEQNWFGASVSLSGPIAAVGDPRAGTGTVHVFDRTDQGWQEAARLTPDDTRLGIQFGTSVAASGDAVLAGAPSDVLDGVFISEAGSAYAFSFAPQTLRTVFPAEGGDTGRVRMTIHGSGFATDATVRLLGPSTIESDATLVSPSGLTVRAAFDFEREARGVYDVEVVNPDGRTARLDRAFTIVPTAAPEIWVDLTGRPAVRPDRPTPYSVTYGNRGNVDAYLVPLTVAIPAGVEWDLGVDVQEFPRLDGAAPAIPFEEQEIAIVEGDTTYLALLLPAVPAGGTGSFELLLTPTAAGDVGLRAWAGAPLTVETVPEGIGGASKNGDLTEFFGCAATSLLSIGLSSAGLRGDPACLREFSLAFTGLINGIAGLAIENANQGRVSTFSAVGFGASIVGFMTKCASLSAGTRAATAAVRVARLANFAGVALGAAVVASCIPTTVVERVIQVVTSFDPNEKVGSQGAGGTHYLTGREPLRYSVYFENLPAATAPAQEVFVEDVLPADQLDLSTFSLGTIRWGTEHVLRPPLGSTEYTATVDLRPDQNLLVRVTARLDAERGVLTWQFTSLDPDTGDLPADPFAGFLPPNTNAPDGEGRVDFVVAPAPGLPSGTTIANRAEIVFDTNEPIITNLWRNTLDQDRPQSTVRALTTPSDTAFTVSWEGSDAVSGIGSYTVWVSADDGPFRVWQQGTTDTSAVFEGAPGTTYAFYSTAWDRAGNAEAAPTVPDAVTTVDGTPIPVELGSFRGRAAGESVVLAWTTAAETNNAGFAVERSRDGQSFARVGFVGGRGTTRASATYRFTDATPPFADTLHYRLRQEDLDGTHDYSPVVTVGRPPLRVALLPNAPNPVRTTTRLRFTLPDDAAVSLVVYDVLGRRVASLVEGEQPAGRHTVTLDGSRLAPGIYFVRLRAGDAVETQRVAVIR